MAVQVTDELRVLVEAEVEKAIKNIEKFDKALGSAEKEAESLGSALSEVEKKTLVMSGIMIAAGGAALKFAADNESLEASLEVLLGSAEKAAKVFAEWKEFGASTPLSVEEIAGAGKSLLAFGVDANEVTETLRRLGDVSQGIGSRIGDIAEIYGKARVQGRLFAQDINQFQGRGIPIVSALAKELGVTENAIKDMVAEGKIGFKELETVFKSLTTNGGQFEGMMDKLSSTTMGKFSTATDNAQQALASFGELLLPLANDVLDFASDAFSALENLDNGTKRFILGMGSVVAISGPAIAAIVGINKALTVLGKNPYVLGITAVIAGVSLLTGFLATQKTQAEKLAEAYANDATEADKLLSVYGELDGEKVLDKRTTEELIRLYPELSRQMRDYGLSVDEARHQVNKFNLLRNTTNHADYQRILIEQARAYDEIGMAIPGLSSKMFEAAKETKNFSLALQEAANADIIRRKINDLSSNLKEGSEVLKNDADYIREILEEPLNTGSTNWWEGSATVEDQIQRVMDALSGMGNLKRQLTETTDWAKALADKNINAMIDILKDFDGSDPRIKTEIARLQQQLTTIISGATISSIPRSGASGAAAKKSWMTWWEEITNVPEDLFAKAKHPGLQAGTLFVEGLERGLSAGKKVSDILGEKLDLSSVLKTQNDDIQKTLVELFSINPNDIDEPFEAINKSIETLTKQFQENTAQIKDLKMAAYLEELTQKNRDFGKSEEELALARLKNEGATEAQIEAIKKEMDEYSRKDILESLRQEVEGLTQDKYELALASLTAAGATEEEIEQANKYIATLEQAQYQTKSFEEVFTKAMVETLPKVFKDLDDQAAKTIADIAYNLTMVSFDGIINGLEALGEAFAAGDNAAEAFKASMVSMAQDILNILPMLFLQAGLQLIANNNWPMGLAFIAAAGSSALIKGFVSGTINKETEKANLNAHGNAYNETHIMPYAKGGTFTNQIITAPTYFRHGGGLGLMGEAGPEAIIPLKRATNGDLGVSLSGAGSAAVIVNIINNTGADVQHEERTGSDGNREIDIIIGAVVEGHISSGRYDSAFQGRYDGLKKRGL